MKGKKEMQRVAGIGVAGVILTGYAAALLALV